VLSNKNGLPVAYASRPLNTAEKKYPTSEKELLAIVWAVKYFRPYLYGRTFRIITDHRALIYLFSMNNPSSRLTKFRLCLEEYDFTAEYLKGQDNVAADAFARIVITSEELKNMTKQVISVMTRAQTKRMEEKAKNHSPQNKGTNYDWSAQPQIVELSKRPEELPQLSFDKHDYCRILQQTDHVTSENNLIVYSSSLATLCVEPDTLSRTKRAVFVRELGSFCKAQQIKEVCILHNIDTACIIEELAQQIKKCTIGSQPRRVCSTYPTSYTAQTFAVIFNIRRI
jgi:hypothetical protein